MDSRRRPDVSGASDAALDFIRFCHKRRRVGWPELYDEMCAVASRGIFRGWGFHELAEHGIAFGLTEMPYLARLVGVVTREDLERRGCALAGVGAAVPGGMKSPDEASEDGRRSRLLIGAAN